MSLLDRAIVRALPAVPKPVVRRLSARYIAGPELADARRVVAELNAAGKRATVDVLGEEITRADEAHEITQAYLDMLDAIDADGLDANVSVKLTGLGLEVDPALCRENLAAIAERGTFVRIDMEDSSTTDATLELYRDLTRRGLREPRRRAPGGAPAGPRTTRARSPARTSGSARGSTSSRPRSPTATSTTIRASYVRTLETLLDGGCYVGIATHDEWLVEQGLRAVRERGLEPDAYEFQMLLGVRPELGDRLVRAGHGSASTSPSAASGTSTRSGGCRRTRRSPATWPAISDARSSAGGRRYGGGGPGGPVTTSSSSTTVVSRRGTARRRTTGSALDVRGAPVEPAPARPEDHREDEPEKPDDEQDDADRVDVEPLGFRRDAPRQNRADCDQENADCYTHGRRDPRGRRFLSVRAAPPRGRGATGRAHPCPATPRDRAGRGRRR